MSEKPTYEELELRVKELEKEAIKLKRVEEALFREKHFSKSILEILPGIFYVFDDTGKYLQWNKNLEKVSGYSAEEISSMNPLDFFEGEDKQNVAEKIQEVFIKGKSFVEADLVSKNSTKTPYYFTGVLIQTDNKNHLGGMGINITERKQAQEDLRKAHDELERQVEDRTAELVMINEQLKEEIAERKRAEDTLRKNEARLSKINECFLNFLPDTLANINKLTSLCGKLFGATCSLYNRLDQGLLYSWGQWNVPLGYNPVDKPDGHICYDVIKNGADEVFVVSDLQKTNYAQTDPNVIPYKLQTYIGKAVKFGDSYVGSLCVVFQDDYVPSESDKKIIGIIAAAIGVEEERRQAGEALRDSEERYRALADSAFEAVFISEKGICTDTNQAATKMFGYKYDELIGIFGTDVIAPESKELVKHNMLSGHEEPYEAVAQRKDGATFYTEIRGKMTQYKSKDVRITVVNDINDRKRAEETLRQAHDELEMKVERRTSELVKANERLKNEIEERKKAEATLREKEKKLAYQAEHLEEVNTALKVLLEHREEERRQSDENIMINLKKLILPYIEKMEKNKLNDKNATYLGIVKSNLTQMVSPFANRLSSKFFELTPSEIQIADLIKHGKTSKEIASLLNVSPKAISFHRGNIRKKLGLSNKKINLRSYLQSFLSAGPL